MLEPFRDSDSMNVLDFIIILMVGVMVGLGFFLGIGRVTSAIIALYFSAIVAATFYLPISDLLSGFVDEMNPATAELLAFVVLFLGMAAIFSAVISRSVRTFALSGRFAILDNIGGATLGILIAGATIALSMTVTTILLQVLNETTSGAASGMLGTMRDQVQTSALAPIFLKLLPVVTSTIRPWFPSGLPSILESPANI